jgi:hypothetical protein
MQKLSRFARTRVRNTDQVHDAVLAFDRMRQIINLEHVELVRLCAGDDAASRP